MKIDFHCTACGAELTSEEQFRGEVIRCPSCRAEVIVPLTSVGPGAVVGGFKILRKIGVGGMGTVYLAEQKSMGRLVALKVLPPAYTRDQLFFDRFMKEVRMQGSLSHPNIATAYDAGKFGDICYMAMEYVEGFDLADMIEKRGHIEERAALRIIRKIATGLAYAWQKKHLIHRDIKPGNIMIAPNAEVKILDLGVSKTMHPSGHTQHPTDEQVIGTPHYMSPEQMRESSTVDIRSDIYSLGATFYHMLSGQPPFPGENLVEVVSKQAKGDAPSPQEKHPELSDACLHLLEVMMARDPAERHDTWEHCIADINRVLLGRHPGRPSPVKHGSLVKRSSRGPERAGSRPLRSARKGMRIVAGIGVAGLVWLMMLRVLTDTPDPASRDGARGGGEEVANVVPQLEPARIDATEAAREGDDSLVAPPSFRDADARESGDLEVVTRAGERANAIRKKRSEEVRMALQELDEEVTPLIEGGKYVEAAAVLRGYEGAMASETARLRLRRALALEERAKERSEGIWERLREELAARLVRDRSLEEGLLLLSRARSDEAFIALRDEVDALEAELNDALRIPDEVIATFTNEIGREVDVQFVRGSKKLMIEKIDVRSVVGKEVLSQGVLQYTFGYQDLAPQEKANRLARMSSPAATLALGMLALDAEQPESAAVYFGRADSVLGGLLADALASAPEP